MFGVLYSWWDTGGSSEHNFQSPSESTHYLLLNMRGERAVAEDWLAMCIFSRIQSKCTFFPDPKLPLDNYSYSQLYLFVLTIFSDAFAILFIRTPT